MFVRSTRTQSALAILFAAGALAACQGAPAPSRTKAKTGDDAADGAATAADAAGDESALAGEKIADLSKGPPADDETVIDPYTGERIPPMTEEELRLIAAKPADLTPDERRTRAFALRKRILRNPESAAAKNLREVANAMREGKLPGPNEAGGPVVMEHSPAPAPEGPPPEGDQGSSP